MFFAAILGALPERRPSFEEIFREHGRFVWRTVIHLGVPERDAPDVSQEVFVVVHRKLGGFEGRSKLRTWIYGICVRTASDYRRRAVRREEPTEAPLSGDATEHPDEIVRRRQALTALHAALGRLDEDKRAVFVLFEIEQLSMREVADAVGCPVQTAYARLYAARALVTQAFPAAAAAEGT